MHGGACSKNTTNRVSIGLQPFLAFEALIVIYIVPQRGTIAPPALPLWHFRAVPLLGEIPCCPVWGVFVPVFKKQFLIAWGRRGWGNFNLSMPFRVWAS